MSTSSGAEMIALERQRQVLVEGYDADHDVGHAEELAAAALCYAGEPDLRDDTVEEWWPWDRRYWKPVPGDRVRELVKAGALLAAAIDAELASR